MGIRVGTGYDLHRLAEGRPLVLGGVNIPFEKGCLGHSDGDALIHAIIDAMLGAAALGDIGQHFPDTSEAYAGVYSIDLLEETATKLSLSGFTIGNIDATIILQLPKIAPFIRDMRQKIAAALTMDIDQISIKATTAEGLGATGRGESVEAHAVCLLESAEQKQD